jgi:hypothetical protein
MNLEGTVSRIWKDPKDGVVSLIMKGDGTIHRFLVEELTGEEVGLTKPGDVLQVRYHDGPDYAEATQWNNQSLAEDMSQ